MRTTVRYHDLADLELCETSKYYETELTGLGEAFLSEVKQAVDQIREFPEAAPIVLDVVRQKIVRLFPYSVMYVADDDGIFIVAIASQHRRPFYWSGRS